MAKNVYQQGEGQTLIFLHGWTMTGAAFAGQFSRLADHFHCVAPDLPGHGTSRHLEATIDRCGEFLNELICDLEKEEVILVGWSMGAAVAWNYLRRFGDDKVSGLVTVDMSPKIVNEGEWNLGLVGRTTETIAASTAHLLDDWRLSSAAVASGMFATEVGPEHFTASYASRIIADQTPKKMHQMWVELTQLDERDSMSKIEVPWLVCFGEESRAYGQPVAEWVAAQSPHTTLCGFQSTGHSPHIEAPDAFAKALKQFVAELL